MLRNKINTKSKKFKKAFNDFIYSDNVNWWYGLVPCEHLGGMTVGGIFTTQCTGWKCQFTHKEMEEYFASQYYKYMA